MMRVKRQKPIFMLVGNKCDKAYEREVSREEGAAMARSFGCEFLETSAKTAMNVERLFMNLVRALRDTRGDTTFSIPNGGPQRVITVDDSQLPKQKKKKCVIM